MKRRFLLLALPLAACASQPPRAWAVQPVPGAVRPGVTRRIGIRSVGLPGALDQSALLAPAAPGSAPVYGNDLWAGSLAPVLQAVMTQDLAQRLPNAVVLDEDGSIGTPADVYLETQVFQFSPDATGLVTLVVQLALRPAASAAVGWQVQSFTASAPGGTTPQGLVAAMSTLWGRAADEVTALL